VVATAAVVGLVGCRSNARTPEAREDPQAVEDVAADLHGRIVAVQTLDHDAHRVVVVPISGGEARPLVTVDHGSTYPAAVFPDAPRVLVLHATPGEGARSRDRLGVVDLGTGEASEPVPVDWFGPEGSSIRHPSLDPEGRFVVYESDAESFRDLYRLRIGAAQAQRLTDDEAGNFEPSTSPDGGQIVFVSSRDGDPEIYRMGVRGGRAVRLTHDRASDTDPAWSPDGETIAFVSDRDPARGSDVYLMRPDGGEQRPSVATPEAERGAVMARHLTFSPDGRYLAFTEQRSRAADVRVVVVDVAARKVVARSQGATADEWPAWDASSRFVYHARGSGPERSELAWLRVFDGRAGVIETNAADVVWMPRWIAD